MASFSSRTGSANRCSSIRRSGRSTKPASVGMSSATPATVSKGPGSDMPTPRICARGTSCDTVAATSCNCCTTTAGPAVAAVGTTRASARCHEIDQRRTDLGSAEIEGDRERRHGHKACSQRMRAARSGAPNANDPSTTVSAPAARSTGTVDLRMPPSAARTIRWPARLRRSPAPPCAAGRRRWRRAPAPSRRSPCRAASGSAGGAERHRALDRCVDLQHHARRDAALGQEIERAVRDAAFSTWMLMISLPASAN